MFYLFFFLLLSVLVCFYQFVSVFINFICFYLLLSVFICFSLFLSVSIGFISFYLFICLICFICFMFVSVCLYFISFICFCLFLSVFICFVCFYLFIFLIYLICFTCFISFYQFYLFYSGMGWDGMGLWRHRFYEHRSAVLTIIMISQLWNAFSSNKKNSFSQSYWVAGWSWTTHVFTLLVNSGR